MGRPIPVDLTNLIQNGNFDGSVFWNYAAPWTVSNGKAHWPTNADTLTNNLRQNISPGTGYTYQCHFKAEIINEPRLFRFHVGSVTNTFGPTVGLYDVDFEVVAPAFADFEVSVAGAAGPTGEFDIWDIEMLGVPVGDPMYDMIWDKGFIPGGLPLTDYTNLGAGRQMFKIACRSDNTNVSIKTDA